MMLGMIVFWPQMVFFCINYNWRISFIEAKFVGKYENELRDVGFCNPTTNFQKVSQLVFCEFNSNLLLLFV